MRVIKNGKVDIEATKKNMEETLGVKLPECMCICECENQRVGVFFKGNEREILMNPPEDVNRFAEAFVKSQMGYGRTRPNHEIRGACNGNYVSGG